MSLSCKDLVRQANSSRIKYAYSALIQIRKNFTKSNGVQVLVAAGLVRRLVELVRTRDTLPDGYKAKVVDISLSIMANMCMEQAAREQVLKANGVPELGDLFLESEVKNLLHRSCRCLANILLSPKAWEPVHGLGILEKLAELLIDTDDDDCKQTYIRTVRLLGQTPKHVGLLLENNLVCAAAKHLDADNDGVKTAAFRCVRSLSFHGCTAQFARQIVKSGKVGYLLGLLPEQSQEVFPLICKLAEYNELRPQFGNDGGIANFIQYFRSSEKPYSDLKVEILNVLCLCCQESVNRMKLRENDALPIFLESLTDDKFKVLHERIVSAFVCFMYDEQSFKILLDSGMVEIVRKLFTEYMKLSSEEVPRKCKPAQRSGDVEESSQPDTGEQIQKDKEVEEDASKRNISEVKSKNSCNDKAATSEHAACLDKEVVEYTAEESENRDRVLVSKEQENSSRDRASKDDDINIKDEEGVESMAAEDPEDCNRALDNKPLDNKELRQWPKYSINSPTYESVAKELDEGYADGPKCIESFTPPHSQDIRSSPYSPLSNSSYYSPSGSSPDLSGNSSETSPRGGHTPRCSLHQRRVLFDKDSSPEDGSTYPKHKYTGFRWSPDTSPERSTGVSAETPSCSGNMKSSTSSAEDSNIKARDTSSRTLSSDTLCLSVDGDSVFEENLYSPVIDTQDFETEYAKTGNSRAENMDLLDDQNIDVKPESRMNQEPTDTTNKMSKLELEKNQEEANIGNKTKKRPKREMYKKRKRCTLQNISFEKNVLQLLSRVQVLNPILYIVPLDMLNCLFDYLCTMESPLTRVAKILSRTLRDRFCFEHLIKLKVPALIFEKLSPERSLPALVSELVVRRKYSTRIAHWPEIFEFPQTNSLVTERFSVTEDPSRQPNKRSRFTDSDVDCPKSSKSKDAQQTDVCSLAKCQVAFIEDLATVADAEFGCGVIERISLTSAEGLPVEISMCLPLISWSAKSRKFYFKHLKITDQLLKVLETKDCKTKESKLFTTIVLGFGFLVRTSDIGTKYRDPFSTRSWRHLRTSSQGDTCESVCKVDEHSKASDESVVVFIVEGEKIAVCKTVLTRKSEYFAAMLAGSYKEANLTEIRLPETSRFVLEYMVHYTYGCTIDCPFIHYLHTGEVCRESLKCCTDLLGEVDKHLLPELRDDLIKNVIGRFIVPECAWPVFEYAVVTDHIQLQKAAVACLLADSDLACLRRLFCEFLESRFSQVFLQTIYEILTEG